MEPRNKVEQRPHLRILYIYTVKEPRRTTEKNIFAYSAKMWEKSKALHIINFDWVNTDTGVFHRLNDRTPGLFFFRMVSQLTVGDGLKVHKHEIILNFFLT